MVEVRFASRQLHGRCGTKRQRMATFGVQTAHALAVRLAQLAAISNVADIAVIPCASSAARDGQLLVEVDQDLSLLLRPLQSPSERLEAVEVIATVYRGRKER